MYARNGHPWTVDEDQSLRFFLATGYSISKISSLLGRTPFAIECRIDKLTHPRPVWRDEQLTAFYEDKHEVLDALSYRVGNLENKVNFLEEQGIRITAPVSQGKTLDRCLFHHSPKYGWCYGKIVLMNEVQYVVEYYSHTQVGLKKRMLVFKHDVKSL